MNQCQPSGLNARDQKLLADGLILPVMEMFYSIQGEGYNTGKAAGFVRVGGCDVGCSWCDVKEAWDASLHPLTPLETIVDTLSAYPSKAVVITGGEPLMYNMGPLTAALKNKGITIFLETSGAYQVSGTFDWICLSPKTNIRPRPDTLLMADELKVIVHQESDFDWAKQHIPLVKEKCRLYLQPEWSRYNQMLPHIVEYVQQNPQWMVSLQAHKFMNIP